MAVHNKCCIFTGFWNYDATREDVIMKVFKVVGVSPLLFLIVLMCNSCAGSDLPPPEVVSELDVNRYLGTWYEIARLPFSIQDGCVGTTATYELRDDGNIRVINRCYDESFDGDLREAEGKAWIVDKKTGARLEVQFFWPFTGDYWVLDLGENYEYSLVGTPNYKYLWILSRKSVMDGETYSGIVARAKALGYDTEMLIKTEQKKQADQKGE